MKKFIKLLIYIIRKTLILGHCFKFRINGFLEDIQVDHLNDFVVDNIDFSLLRLKLDFSFRLPELVTVGIYNIDAEYLNRIKLWGNGEFSIKLNGNKIFFLFRSNR